MNPMGGFGFGAFGPAFLGGFLGTLLVLMVIIVASMWKIYDKAGKPGWAALIPIYNIVVWLEIIKKPWWWLLLMLFLPYVGVIWAIWATNLLAKAFGKNEAFTVGLVLLPIIFYPILAFDGSEYNLEGKEYDY